MVNYDSGTFALFPLCHPQHATAIVSLSATTTIFEMPATRSNPQGTIQTPYPTSSPPKAQKKRAVKNTNIIDLIDTSDASSSSSSIVPQAKPKSRSRPPPRSTPAPTFIIDISSDDDQEVLLFASPKATVRAPTPEPARIAEYRRDVAKYRTVSFPFVFLLSKEAAA